MTKRLIIKTTTEFIVQARHGEIDDVAPDEPLFEQGIVDEAGMSELIAFLEDTYNIKLAKEELNQENLKTINNIASLVYSKTSLQR